MLLGALLVLALAVPMLAVVVPEPAPFAVALGCALVGARLALIGVTSQAWSGLGSGVGVEAVAAVACALVAVAVAAAGASWGGIAMGPMQVGTATALATWVLLGAHTLARTEARQGADAPARRVFFVGPEEQRTDLAQELAGRGGMRLTGSCVLEPGGAVDPEGLIADVEATGASVLVLADEAIRRDDLVAVATELNLRGMRVRDLRAFYEQRFGKVAVSELSPAWFLFDIAEIHRRGIYGRAKRVIEMAVALLVLAVAGPLLAPAALAVKLSSSGPVLFRQVRIGKGGHPFTVTKLRTMHAAVPDEAPQWADACTRRIFPAGRLLRKFRIDELPQLVSVLRGDLSLVGPRPEQPAIVAELEHSMPFYAARHCVRPGLTGWAQVNFGYGGSDEGVLRKLQYDLFYIKRQGVTLDLRIVAATVRTVLAGAGR